VSVRVKVDKDDNAVDSFCNIRPHRMHRRSSPQPS